MNGIPVVVSSLYDIGAHNEKAKEIASASDNKEFFNVMSSKRNSSVCTIPTAAYARFGSQGRKFTNLSYDFDKVVIKDYAFAVKNPGNSLASIVEDLSITANDLYLGDRAFMSVSGNIVITANSIEFGKFGQVFGPCKSITFNNVQSVNSGGSEYAKAGILSGAVTDKIEFNHCSIDFIKKISSSIKKLNSNSQSATKEIIINDPIYNGTNYSSSKTMDVVADANFQGVSVNRDVDSRRTGGVSGTPIRQKSDDGNGHIVYTKM